MKLIVQIPCFDEEATLPRTVADIPRQIPGLDRVEILVVDDGSTDGTVEVARQLGVDHIVQHVSNKGLAAAFQTGLDACLKLGADIIVNTDADNQYPGYEIPRLVEPIVQGKADMVVGDRQIQTIDHFSLTKKSLQWLGSLVVRLVAGSEIPDAPSGFRAMSREAALRLNVLTRYTYTLETLVQASKKNLVISSIPITTGPKTRESRLISSTWTYVWRSTATILWLYVLYEPLRTFFYVSLPFLLGGLFLILRFFYFYTFFLITQQSGVGRYIQSVVIGGTLLTLGLLIFLIGLLAHLIAVNRQLLEESLYRTKRLALNRSSDDASQGQTEAPPEKESQNS